MSAIIELRNPSDRIYNRVRKFLKKAEFVIDIVSARYLAVRYDGVDVTEIDQVLDKLTSVPPSIYKGMLIPPSRSLDEYKKASGRVAMAFRDGDKAEEGLKTMFPALKYENPKTKTEKKK